MEALQAAISTACFVAAFNGLLARKTEIVENYALCLDAITNTSAYQARLDAINRECGELSTLINALLQKGSKQSGSLQEINRQYEEYVARYDALQQEKQEVSAQIALCAAKRVQVGAFLAELEKQKMPMVKFDPLVWQATLNHMKVNSDCTVTFVFRDGTEVSQPIEPGVRQYKKRKGTEGSSDGD